MSNNQEEKPRFFDLIGWSWVIMGALGVLLGLLSLPSLFNVSQINTLLEKMPLSDIPGVLNFINGLMTYYVPFTLSQILLSIIMTIAGWKFLERANWARLGLSILNGVTLLMVIGGGWTFLRFFEALSVAVGMKALVKAGLIRDIPFIVACSVWGAVALLVLPIIWMAWYFHCGPVRQYCSRNQPA